MTQRIKFSKVFTSPEYVRRTVVAEFVDVFILTQK